MRKRRFSRRHHRTFGPITWSVILCATLVGVAVAAFTAWQPWYVANTWRLATQGWTTTVDLPIYAPNAADTYSPLEQVRGAPAAPPLVRRAGDDSHFAAAVDYAGQHESYALLIWHRDAIVLERYWAGAGRDSRPDGASTHKSVTALAVGAAIADGKIGSIDDPVERYLTEWRGTPEGQIRIRSLLQMASGLGTFSTSGGWFSEANRFLSGLGTEQLLLGRKLIGKPDDSFTYRNLNTQLLGLIVERSTGRRYAEYLSEAIWQPIGAGDAYVWLDRAGGLARTYTALLARPEDWLRLGILIKDHGAISGRQIVPAEWIDAMTTASPANANYGYQIWRAQPYQAKRYYNPVLKGLSTAASEPIKADDMVFFDGVGGQRVYVSAALDLVIVRLGVARPDWDDSALPNAVIAALANEEPQ